MERRRVLQILALGSAGTVATIGGASLMHAVTHASEHHWGYTGEGGPEHWSELSPESRVCGLGQEQSPIDLHHPIAAEVGTLTINYHAVPLKLLNNGHTIQVNIDETSGNTLVVNDKTYTLKQFHFHHPSEHTVEGVAFPMELHLVHTNEAGEIAVLGVFLQEGAENPTLKPIWAAMPFHESEILEVRNTQIDPTGLLPEGDATFRYFGSLTTPPCSEIVTWIVFQTPLAVSREQIERFTMIFASNARPVQPQHRRIVLESL